MNDDPSDYEILQGIPKRKPQKAEPISRAHNERQYWLEKTVIMLKMPFPRVARMVQGWPCEWLRDNYLYVNRAEVSSPPALWMWMQKNPKVVK